MIYDRLTCCRPVKYEKTHHTQKKEGRKLNTFFECLHHLQQKQVEFHGDHDDGKTAVISQISKFFIFLFSVSTFFTRLITDETNETIAESKTFDRLLGFLISPRDLKPTTSIVCVCLCVIFNYPWT
jgi:hypothetical protein